ncbi:hypothetical protein ACFQU7_23345 [Pseudoroseomonas wenyumeiae]
MRRRLPVLPEVKPMMATCCSGISGLGPSSPPPSAATRRAAGGAAQPGSSPASAST